MRAPLEYRPGPGTLVVAGDRVCLIDDDAETAPASEIWSVLSDERDGGGIDGVFEALADTYGFRDLPAFVVLLAEDHCLRVVRRGALSLWATTGPDSGALLDLVQQTPWATHELAMESVGVGTPDGTGLPLLSGVVRAHGFTWQRATSGEAPRPASASTVAVSAPATPVARPAADPEPAADPTPTSGYTDLFQRLRPAHQQEVTAGPSAQPDATPAESGDASTRTWSDDPLLVEGPDDVVPSPEPPHTPPRAQVPPPRTARSMTPGTTTKPPSSGVTSIHRSIPDVKAIACPAGHWNASNVSGCRVCQVSIPRQPSVSMPRPSLGRLWLPGGEALEVDRGAVFGRSPQAPDGGVERPHLINVSKFGPHLSRMHAEVVIEGWSVLVRDLGSTEGTTLTVPGQAPRHLLPQEAVLLRTGSTIDLAGDYAITFEAH